MSIKLMVIGYARHGKDSVCNLLRELYGLRFISSSFFVAEKAVRPWLEQRGFSYPDFDSMYADRVNHRADWFDAIADYNKIDPGRLGKELYAEFDIYAGIRNLRELEALRRDRVFDCALWVDASKRVEKEPESSNNIHSNSADYIIDNNGPEDNLRGQVIAAYEWAKVYSANK